MVSCYAIPHQLFRCWQRTGQECQAASACKCLVAGSKFLQVGLPSRWCQIFQNDRLYFWAPLLEILAHVSRWQTSKLNHYAFNLKEEFSAKIKPVFFCLPWGGAGANGWHSKLFLSALVDFLRFLHLWNIIVCWTKFQHPVDKFNGVAVIFIAPVSVLLESRLAGCKKSSRYVFSIMADEAVYGTLGTTKASKAIYW